MHTKSSSRFIRYSRYVSAAALLSLAPLAVTAQEAEQSSEDAEALLDRVIVTGTRASDRTVLNSPVPIDVVTAVELQSTGKANLLEALQNLLPAFNVPASIQPDLGSIVRGGQLRNLDPGYTLVLVNGKRRHTTAVTQDGGFAGSVWVDLGLIPTSAIERIEVLRDGASALYGSDAIAGVINIILKSDAKGGDLSIEYGQSYKGDGGVTKLRGSVGLPLGEKGFLHLSGDYSSQELAVRNSPLNDTYLLYPAIDSVTGLPVRLGPQNSLPAGATPDPREASRPHRPWFNSGVPEYDTISLGYNLGYEFSEELSVYSFGTYSNRKAASPQNLRPANTLFVQNPGLLQVYPDGFTPWEETDEDDFEFVAGVRGTLAGWDWDLSNAYGRDDVDVSVTNSANYSLTYPGAKTDFYAGAHIFSQNTTNLDVSRAFENSLFAAPVELSLGLEHQRHEFELKQGEPDSFFGQGSQAITGYLPIDALSTERNSSAAYVNLSTSVTDKLFVDLAARYEDHSDFGSVTTGRLSTRYDFTSNFGARLTISNGFHAPALVTQSYSTTSDSVGVVNRLAPSGSPEAAAVGGRPLEPEKAKNISFGFTWAPVSNVNVALDAYQIDIDNRVALSPNIGYDRSDPANPRDASGQPLTPAQEAIIDNLIAAAGLTPTADVFRVRYFTNAGDTQTRGVDLTVEAVTPTDNYGRFRWTFAANYNETKLKEIPQVPVELRDLPNINLLSAAAQLNLTNRAPNTKLIFGSAWDLGNWRAGARLKYYGELERLGNGNYYTSPASWLVDIHAGYDFENGVSVDVGVDNLFDKYPDKLDDQYRTVANVAQYQYAYDNSGPVGLLGGFAYARLSYRF